MQKVSPQKTPQVVGKLLDLEVNEEFVRTLLNSVGQLCPVAELVEQVRTYWMCPRSSDDQYWIPCRLRRPQNNYFTLNFEFSLCRQCNSISGRAP